jgi:uncharacterized tellurite resistance protein B-like protein
MNLNTLNETQRAALVDLLVLGMYSDGHLATAEEARIRQVIVRLGADGDEDIARVLDASITRVRQQAANPAAASAYASLLAQAFLAGDQRRQVGQLVAEVIESDRHITATETSFAALVREALRL